MIALLLFVFEPTILASGALVTTDIAVSATLFGTVYAFYRYTKRPTVARLLVCAVAAGLVLCVKHSGPIVFPLLLLLAVGTLLLQRVANEQSPAVSRRGQAVRFAVALVIIGAISYTMLWAAYGFRYAARPATFPLSQPHPRCSRRYIVRLRLLRSVSRSTTICCRRLTSMA